MLLALTISTPVLLLVGWTMYAGVSEPHELSRRRALTVIVTAFLFWLATGGIAALGLSTG